MIARLATVVMAVALACPAWAQDTEFAIDRDESVFAVVTHKGGVAARFAHNHFVFPREYEYRITSAQKTIEDLTFSLSFKTSALASDLPDAQKKWFPELKRSGVLKDPFREIAEDDRVTIREHMLAEDQLDAKGHPDITAELIGLRRESATLGEAPFDWMAKIALTVRGKRVEREIPARITLKEGNLSIDAIGAFRFTEFGIKPYSAMLGAVKNEDEFHVFAHIQARAGAAAESGG
ncbi:MAG: YceI family protein [Candidatus Hydrogenedentes bacterium]|nr:YceI family protein [Candidatus Hydrogenedentota bacterium]